MKVNVTNMTCGHCKITIEKALVAKGFDNVKIDLANHTVDVELKGRTEKEVVDIIESKGYDVKL